MRGSRTLHCPPLLQFWIVAEATPGQVLPVSTTKRSQKEVSLFELSKSKSTVQREVGCWCFQKLASCTWKESYTLLQPGSVFKVCKGLKKRFEDLHSLSLKFCLTKFVRTIERAFVQVSHSFANWFLNARVWISTHFRLHKTQAMSGYFNIWAAFTYSFAVHRCPIKRHSQRPCKLCYIVNTRNLLIKKRKTKKKQTNKQKLVVMNKSDKSSH